jgi:hypothetical protein
LAILDRHIETSEDKIILTAETSDAFARSTRDDGREPLLVGLAYELGGRREIDLGTWDLSNCDFEVVYKIVLKSEKKFRLLLAELEASSRPTRITSTRRRNRGRPRPYGPLGLLVFSGAPHCI